MTLVFVVVIVLALAAPIVFLVDAGTGYLADARLLAASENVLDTYLVTEPRLAHFPFVGEEEAPITLVIVVDPLRKASKEQYTKIVPFLMKYVETGQARLYHKHYVAEQDFKEKKGRFIYAAAASCYARLDGQDHIAWHYGLFKTGPEELDSLATSFGLSEAFADCMHTFPPGVYEEMLETRLFRIRSPSIQVGIEGQDPTILYGVPSPTKINRTIRSKQVTFGI